MFELNSNVKIDYLLIFTDGFVTVNFIQPVDLIFTVEFGNSFNH